MERFKNTYKINSTRLQNWDYGWNGSYFVTINTKEKEYYFGEIIGAKMILSEIGRVADQEWRLTPNIRPDMNIKLGVHVIMPNHFHGIIRIGENIFNRKYDQQSKQGRDAMHRVFTSHQFGPQRKNLSSIIRGYKSVVTTYAKKHNIKFGWQISFYDRIITDSVDYMKCEKYILNNPTNWK
ncbi:MAG: transposase [Candidatus Marinimicrobia bacterium]|nr:transposase [Candidatus Neomarinimicrobiota bacterium]